MSISYELAKNLKDAGFPVKDYRPAADIFEGGFVAPTLSELIEACGKDFGKLERFDHRKTAPLTGLVLWYAYEANEMRNLNKEGSTPEEAVARLWLALNKK